LLPLELMACGCPVVSNRGPNTEWLLNDANAMLVDATPAALADGILRVLQDDELHRRLSVSGKEFAQASNWKTEAEKVIGALEELRNRTPASVT
jgi:O-antigen biosynthesis protein